VKPWAVRDWCFVRANKGHGRWSVQIFEISADGRFAKVGTGHHGQFGKPRWVAVSTLQRK
jgi:hypothetical protein